MSQRRAQTRSGRTSDPSSDKANRSVSDSPFNPSEEWNGGQVDRAPWLNRLLHIAEGSFEYITLTRTATVSMSKGAIAVFSIEHAKEHLATTGTGTFRKPNMRLREDLSQMYNAPPATTPAPPPPASMSHGGYPLTPPSVPPAPAAGTSAPTYASALSSGRPQTLMEMELGVDAARNYIIAPHVIEEADLGYLNFFLDRITNERLRKHWAKASANSGRAFVKVFLEEMADEEMSMTAENTVQAKIDAIVRGGLGEATMECLMNSMESYENWADVLDTPVPDAKRAYIFKKWVCDLSKDIKMQMELKLAMLEAKSAAKGKDIAKDDPIGLIFKAANHRSD